MHDQDTPRAVSLNTMTIQLKLLDRLPGAFLRKHRVLPHALQSSTLQLVLSDPSDHALLEEVAFITGLTVAAEVASEGDLDKTIEAAIKAWQKGEQTLTLSDGPGVESDDLVYLEDLGGLGAAGDGFAPSPNTAAADDFSFDGGLVDVGAAAGFAGASAAPIPEPQSNGDDSRDLPAVVDLDPVPRIERNSRDAAPDDVDVATPRQRVDALETTELLDDANLLDDVDLIIDVDLVDDDGLETTPVLSGLELEQSPGRRPAAGLGALIAHTDDDRRQRLATELARLGFSTLRAGDTLEVLQHLEQNTPSLILFDIELSGTHPFTLARQLRQEERFANVAIVVLSSEPPSWALGEDLRTTYGVDGILAREADAETVIWAVELALARQRPEPLDLRDPDVKAEALDLVKQGTTLFRRGAVDEAIALFRKGIERDPFQPTLHVSLAIALVKQRQPYKAMPLFERAIALDPNLETAMKNLALLYEKTGFRNKAVELWLRTLHATEDERTRVEIRSRIQKLL